MRYTIIGSDSPAAREVSVLSLGTMWFGTRTDEATSFAILDRYVAAGGNFIDTSAHLADGHAGSPELGDQLEPAEVAFGVATVPGAGPVHTEHQPVALVVAERVPRQAGTFGYLGDR
jgi:aryl-alcohol dehydrogenase-like predicted oxidoreductase